MIFLGIKKIIQNMCLKHNCQAGCVPGTQEDLIQGSLFMIQTQERAEGNGDEKCSVIRKVDFDSHRNGCEWKRLQAFCK